MAVNFYLNLVIIVILIALGFFVIYLYYRINKERKEYFLMSEETEQDLRIYARDLDFLIQILSGMHEFALANSAYAHEEELYQLIIEKATMLMRTEIGSLMLLNPQTNMLEIVASKGLTPDVMKSTKLRIGEGIAGRVFLEGEPIFCPDIEKDHRFMRKSNVKYYSRSFISVPLKVHNRVVGVLNVNNKEEKKAFNEKDLKLLTIITDEAAITIENMRLYQDMKDVYIGTINALARAIDARDPYNRGHTDRVTRYAVQIARNMGLNSLLIENIRFASLIHDIGKIAIPDHILQKKDPLTKAEWEVIKEHSQKGEELISGIEFLDRVAPLVLYHHESFDGRGYPEGLKGEEIPIGARIITVADAYDAMTSDRPYKMGFDKDEAVKELKKNSGTQFDPEVVRVMMKILEV